MLVSCHVVSKMKNAPAERTVPFFFSFIMLFFGVVVGASVIVLFAP